MIRPSTFSIAAYDESSQTWGVAVASKFPAVGAVVPWARAGVGAVATQALANSTFGPGGLDLMSGGLSAEDALARLLAADDGRENRQAGLVDARGGSATFTGVECMTWAGGVSGPGYAIQGNILVGPGVVAAMESAFKSTSGELQARLYAALLAGDRAGGDRRGRQSAAIVVVKDKGGYGGYNDRMLDYRVDDDPDPVLRLGGLLELHSLYFGKSPLEERLRLEGSTLQSVQTVMHRLGYLATEPSGVYDKESAEAFRAFTGNENFEDRCDPVEGWVDAPVYAYLMRKFEK